MNQQLSLIQIPKCNLTETAATFDASTDFASWLDAGKSMVRAGACLNWWIGDWLLFGVTAYGDRTKVAATMADELGMGADSLRQAMQVSERIKVDTRVSTLSWSHHREVIKFGAKQQANWLALTTTNHWSVSDLRQAIRQDEATDQDNEAPASPAPLATCVAEALLWFRGRDLDAMPPEQRAAVREELRPIVDIYEGLA